MNRHDTVGADLVNHCVNDIAVLGARPLFFLDYIGAEKLEPRVFDQLLRGFTQGMSRGRLRIDRRRNRADAGHVSQGRIRSCRLHCRRGRSSENDRRQSNSTWRRHSRPCLEWPAYKRLFARPQNIVRKDEAEAVLAIGRPNELNRRRAAAHAQKLSADARAGSRRRHRKVSLTSPAAA